MPLLKGSSKEVIAENIRTMRGEGRDEAQAVAIAYKHAGKGKSTGKAAKRVANKPKDKGIPKKKYN